MARLLIGNVKGPQGDQGEQGVQGVPGNTATINVGSTTTSAYGTQARVTNSGTSSNAILDFVIPQGAPGEEVTEVGELTVDAITASQAEYPTFTVGEKMKAVLGKIAKYLDDLKTTVNGVSTALGGKAPTNHASTGTDYGVGNATNYGHVRLSDTYNSNVGGASNSLGASQSALYNAYNVLNSNYANLNSKAVIKKYFSSEWSTLHSFEVEQKSTIGIAISHIGDVWAFVQFIDGSVQLNKVYGSTNVTYYEQSGGYNKFTFSTAIGLTIFVG